MTEFKELFETKINALSVLLMSVYIAVAYLD